MSMVWKPNFVIELLKNRAVNLFFKLHQVIPVIIVEIWTIIYFIRSCVYSNLKMNTLEMWTQ